MAGGLPPKCRNQLWIVYLKNYTYSVGLEWAVWVMLPLSHSLTVRPTVLFYISLAARMSGVISKKHKRERSQLKSTLRIESVLKHSRCSPPPEKLFLGEGDERDGPPRSCRKIWLWTALWFFFGWGGVPRARTCKVNRISKRQERESCAHSRYMFPPFSQIMVRFLPYEWRKLHSYMCLSHGFLWTCILTLPLHVCINGEARLLPCYPMPAADMPHFQPCSSTGLWGWQCFSARQLVGWPLLSRLEKLNRWMMKRWNRHRWAPRSPERVWACGCCSSATSCLNLHWAWGNIGVCDRPVLDLSQLNILIHNLNRPSSQIVFKCFFSLLLLVTKRCLIIKVWLIDKF